MKGISNFNYRMIFLLVLSLPIPVFSQSNTYAWGSVFMNGPYRKNWGLHLDAQLRSAEDAGSVKSWLIRPGLQRKINARHSVALGYAYVWTQTIAPAFRSHQSEHRAWQQWIYQQPIGRINLQHRFRLEERFLGATRITEGVGLPAPAVYATRFRYFNRILLPIRIRKSFERGLFGAIQNEFFLNVSGKKKLNTHLYDQNRFYLAGGYRIHPQLDLELGYMNRHIQLVSGDARQHIWQIATYLRPR